MLNYKHMNCKKNLKFGTWIAYNFQITLITDQAFEPFISWPKADTTVLDCGVWITCVNAVCQSILPWS